MSLQKYEQYQHIMRCTPPVPIRLQVAAWGNEPNELHLCRASGCINSACHRHSIAQCFGVSLLATKALCSHNSDGLPLVPMASNLIAMGYGLHPFHPCFLHCCGSHDIMVVVAKAIGATLPASFENFVHSAGVQDPADIASSCLLLT